MPTVGSPRLLDVKSTSTSFEKAVHLSLGELSTATEGTEPYDIYRVFKVNVLEFTGVLRIAEHFGPALKSVLNALQALPHGVVADSLSVDPSILTFDAEEIKVELAEEDAKED